MATRIDFLVRGVVRRRRAFQGLKTLYEQIGPNVHAHSFRFSRTRFLPASQRRPSEPLAMTSDASSDVSDVVVVEVECRCVHVLVYAAYKDDTSDEDIGACSHGITQRTQLTERMQRPFLFLRFCCVASAAFVAHVTCVALHGNPALAMMAWRIVVTVLVSTLIQRIALRRCPPRVLTGFS